MGASIARLRQAPISVADCGEKQSGGARSR
jgi:hypothetical protein